MSKKIDVTELALRDAHQSLFATRMALEDMVPICEDIDQAGYWSVECWGGATFDACIRFLNEDPWERLRTFRSLLPNSKLQMLLRGQNLLGYRHYSDDVVRAFKPDGRSCVVALTHDPKLDDLALLQALDTDAFYVGGIGSRRNNAARRARLKEHFEQTDESLARLRGPIGIYIGSKTPPEIAVSVMAEVLAVKNGVVLPRDMEVGEAKQVRERID